MDDGFDANDLIEDGIIWSSPKSLKWSFLMQHINIKFYLFKVINLSNSCTFFSILQLIVVLEMI